MRKVTVPYLRYLQASVHLLLDVVRMGSVLGGLEVSGPRICGVVLVAAAILSCFSPNATVAQRLEPTAGAEHPTDSPFLPPILASEGSAQDAFETTVLQRLIQERPDSFGVFTLTSKNRRDRLWSDVERFYESRQGEPAWVGNRQRTAELLTLLEGATGHALIPEDYKLGALIQALETLPSNQVLASGTEERLDIALTLSALLYSDHLLRGRIDPDDLDVAWHLAPRERDLAATLETALEAGIGQTLGALKPVDARYAELQRLLGQYRILEAHGGWPTVPEGETLELGVMADANRMEALRVRLMAEGDLPPRAATKIGRTWTRQDRRRSKKSGGKEGGEAAATGRLYGKRFAQAVRQFQRRHGLTVDGKVGPNTTATLNRSVQDRVIQIEINLERWRWLPDPATGKRIRVNVPAFDLEAFGGGGRPLVMNVVVGKPSWQTPIFRDFMTFAEINPYWNVPWSIAVEETLLKVQENPAYLEEEDFEVLAGWEGGVVDPATIDWQSLKPETFEYRFRQRPGPQNALGQIKFMFPNEYSVYLHDTPSVGAFSRDRRALSHGCVRVEKPLDLARWVLAGAPEWSRGRVRRVIESRENTKVTLEEGIPVDIVYFTTYVDRSGKPSFREDIYGYDQALDQALAKYYGRSPAG